MAKFVKGQVANPKGRPKGAINKFSELRNEFLKAYKELGGLEHLLAWAKENNSEFYSHLVRMLPKDVNVDVQGDIVVRWEGECDEWPIS